MIDLDDLEKKALDSIAWHAAGFQVSDEYDTYPDDLYQAATMPESILAFIAMYREEKKAAEFNFEQYQDTGRLLHEECEKTERLQARVAELEAQSGEAVATVLRNVHGTQSAHWLNEDLRHGDKLYLRAPQAVIPPEKIHPWIYPDESREEQFGNMKYINGWNDCRKAMLAAAPSPEGEKE